ncbi:MAG: hypothetical protein RIR00_606 [Pseudomonadota bacterium]|jgi:iron complex transport system permease protein
MPSPRRVFLILATLLLLAVLALGMALAVGSVRLDLAEVWASLLGQETPGREIVLQLRLPRALAAFACGGLLALAGALMQILLRNPLADPYVLGISGGAGVGALLGILFGLGSLGIDSAAFAGALAAMLLVFGLAHGDGSWTQTRLLLTGVIVAAGCGALISLLLALAPEHKLQSMLFWVMGDLSQASEARPALLTLGLALLLMLPFARELNLLARGADLAQTLGVEVRRLRRLIYAVAALCTAAAVTSAGSVGFVGLVVPHLVRLATGNDQRLLLPAATLAGGSLLLGADTLARSLIAPQQLPVGVLTALLGVPVFLYLLSRGGVRG